MHAPLTYEALAIGYFAVLLVAAPWTRAPRDRRRRAMLLCAAVAATIAAAAYSLPADARLWLGHVYLVAAYRLPALLAGPAEAGRHVLGGAPADAGRHVEVGAFETWLIRTDARWFPVHPTFPTWAAPALELSYLFCYVLLPTTFVFVWVRGSIADADRFWTSVLLAGFACYGLLPWLSARPPRVRVAESAGTGGLRRLNLHILRRASHGYNTFPSGHVAVSVAASLEVMPISTAAGVVALAAALAVGAGAVAGRYHYGLDVVLGVVMGATAARL